MRTFRKLTVVELKLFAREPLALVFTFAFPLVVLMTLIGSFEPNDPAFGGARPSDYYLASYVAVVIGAVGLVSLPVHVAAYRERGVLRRFRASSVPAWTVVGSQVVVGLVMATLGAAVLVAAGSLLFGAALPASAGGAAVAFVASTLTFLAIGFLLGSTVRTARGAMAVGLILFFPLWLLSGAGPPPEIMGEGMRRVSEALPLTYAVQALQAPWLGSGSGAGELAVLGAILVAAGGLAVRTLRSA
jgi:ABC-2 type transport system permease protein